MANLIELHTESDLSILQDSLENFTSDPSSLPLRQQLWYFRQKIVSGGHVYVDQWPSFTIICTFFPSQVFITDPIFDFDVAVFYRLDTATNSDFERFLHSLASERRWDADRSLYAQFVRPPQLGIFQAVLCPYGRLDAYGDFTLYTGFENQNSSTYREKLHRLQEKLPSSLIIDTLGPADVPKVIETWPFGPSDMIPSFFRWLLNTFPSICLRNRENQELVAWAMSYNAGAIGHLHIEQAYRGRGLSEYLWLAIASKLADFSPLQVYFDIAPGNTASEKSAKKAFEFDLKKSDKTATWFFFYNRNQWGNSD